MELSKIKRLIDFVGQSSITELTVTEKDTTVRIFRTRPSRKDAPPPAAMPTENAPQDEASTPVLAPIFGVLHAAPAPGENAFVKLGDMVEAGQTIYIIEAMKVFNTIAAPRAGRIVHLTAIDGGEVEAGDLLAEIA
jgi:acetyl-CoA carboxylase biotin carboxyl carrier protein